MTTPGNHIPHQAEVREAADPTAGGEEPGYLVYQRILEIDGCDEDIRRSRRSQIKRLAMYVGAPAVALLTLVGAVQASEAVDRYLTTPQREAGFCEGDPPPIEDAQTEDLTLQVGDRVRVGDRVYLPHGDTLHGTRVTIEPGTLGYPVVAMANRSMGTTDEETAYGYNTSIEHVQGSIDVPHIDSEHEPWEEGRTHIRGSESIYRQTLVPYGVVTVIARESMWGRDGFVEGPDEDKEVLRLKLNDDGTVDAERSCVVDTEPEFTPKFELAPDDGERRPADPLGPPAVPLPDHKWRTDPEIDDY